MTISLTKLQECAERCASWDWLTESSQLAIENDHDYSHLMDEEVRFIASMNPQTALALIRVAKLAKEYRYDELKEALREIEL